MLIEFSVENFLSFKERVTLSMESSSGTKLPQNVIKTPKKGRILKSVAIYGGNSSGKTNLVKAISFMHDMVAGSHNFNINTEINVTPFKLNPECYKSPSLFEMKFIHENITYRYGFSCNSKRIVDEYLFYATGKKEKKIFERRNTENFSFGIDNEQQEFIKSQVIENTLYLSRATQLKYQKTRDPYLFISNLVININPLWGNYTIRKLHEDPELKTRILEIMKKADFGGIENIHIKKEARPVQKVNFNVSQKKESSIQIGNSMDEFFEVKFTHKNENGKKVNFDSIEESDGTNKTLAILGPLFDIMENGKVAVIDEFDTSLHPKITRLLIMLFHSDKNKQNGQLIFTSHDTTLLDNELFRTDQIYFCSKKPNKHTELSSLLDYDVRQVTDFERVYLNGRVGGISLSLTRLF
ncbi:MAG: AAA family ATPase [Methanosarcina sp.]